MLDDASSDPKSGPRPRLTLLHSNTLLGIVIGTIFATVLYTGAHISHARLLAHLHDLQPHTRHTQRNPPPSPVAAPAAAAAVADTVFIGVLSHPRNTVRRAALRLDCFPLLRRYARERGLSLDIKFVMGRAADADYHRGQKIQGRKADADVIALGKTVLQEAALHGDVLPAATVDQYIDTMDKVIALFTYGLRAGAALVAKLDDDTCRNVTGAMWDAWVSRDRPPHFYFGEYLFAGTEYDIMYGVDNTTAPFMAGPCYGLSRELARLVFVRDFVRTTQHHVYATSSEDATVGKLVRYAEKKYLLPRNESVVLEHRGEWAFFKWEGSGALPAQ